jgi:hypothetical protein
MANKNNVCYFLILSVLVGLLVAQSKYVLSLLSD